MDKKVRITIKSGMIIKVESTFKLEYQIIDFDSLQNGGKIDYSVYYSDKVYPRDYNLFSKNIEDGDKD